MDKDINRIRKEMFL